MSFPSRPRGTAIAYLLLVSPSSLSCRALRLRGRARISHLPRRRMKTYRSRVPAARRISRYSEYIGRSLPPLPYCDALPQRASCSRATRSNANARPGATLRLSFVIALEATRVQGSATKPVPPPAATPPPPPACSHLCALLDAADDKARAVLLSVSDLRVSSITSK